MFSVEKVSNVLGDRKKVVATTLLTAKKSLKKDVGKGTGEVEYTKDTLITICRRDLDQFEGKSIFRVPIGIAKMTRNLQSTQQHH